MKKHNPQDGFILMIVVMLAIAGLIIYLAVTRIINARNDSSNVGTSPAVSFTLS